MSILIVDNRRVRVTQQYTPSVKASMTEQLIRTVSRHFPTSTIRAVNDSASEDSFEDSLDIPDNTRLVILSGSSLHLPSDIHVVDRAVSIVEWAREHDVPVLGICFGMQLLAHMYGGKLARRKSNKPYQYPSAFVNNRPVYFNHTDCVVQLPDGFSSDGKQHEGGYYTNMKRGTAMLGVQWHPEGSQEGRSWLVTYIQKQLVR